MEFETLHAAGHALVLLLDPYRLLMLSCGVVMGLVLGILPGIGGLSGTALLLPFTFTTPAICRPRRSCAAPPCSSAGSPPSWPRWRASG
jgi:hypothetical protein